MNGGAEAFVEWVLAILIGLFSGWMVVSGKKTSRKTERGRKERTTGKDNSRAIQQMYEEGMEKLRKQQFLDQLYETSKSQGKIQPKSPEESRDIDEYHK